MKTPTKILLLALVTIAVVLAMVHAFFPGGLPRLIDRFSAPNTAPAAQPAPAPTVTVPSPTGATELRQAETAYDAGDFGRAVDFYAVARADADPDVRSRATRGLQKAILAWALTLDVPLPTPLPDDPDADVALRQAKADKSPSEKAWYDLTIYAAGCGSARKLPFLTRQAIDWAQPGGPVEKRLTSVLATSGSRAGMLRAAMQAQGFLGPVDPVAAAEKPHPAARSPARTKLVPPSGSFTPATKSKLSDAVEFETEGAREYDLSGPDNADRKLHRKASLRLLIQARDIYEIALEEDPNSVALDRRMHDVMEMISHLRKEMNLGD